MQTFTGEDIKDLSRARLQEAYTWAHKEIERLESQLVEKNDYIQLLNRKD